MRQQTYLKVPFVWEQPKPRIEVSPLLTFEPVKATRDNLLISVVARVMASSLDASDRKKVSDSHPHEAAETFLNSSRDGFYYQDEWWQFGINQIKKGNFKNFPLPSFFNALYHLGLTLEWRPSLGLVEGTPFLK